MLKAHPMAKPIPEAPGAHWLWGHLAERRKDPLGLFRRVSAVGDVAAIRIAWRHAYSANHPDAIKHILVDNAQNYSKGRATTFLRPVLGDGLLTAEGSHWMKNRRLMQPAFHRDRVAGLVGLMVRSTEELLSRWEERLRTQPDQPFDVLPDMMTLTMSVVARALFTTDISGEAKEVREALSFVLQQTNRRILNFIPLLMKVPNRANRDFARAVAVMDRVIQRIIQERRQSGAQHQDLLGLLMAARDADTGEGMTDRELRDEAMTLFLAGHETTAVALCWMWWLLAQHPDVASGLRAELNLALKGRAPTPDEVQHLDALRRTWDETLRLYPPAWLLIRQSYAADEVCGYALGGGEAVVVCTYALHRSPKYWPDPERFDPGRFLPQAGVDRPKLAYIPFGAGQRMCIGNTFATVEAQVIAAMVLQRFRFELPEGSRVEPEPLVTLRPRGGMTLRVAPCVGGR